MSNNFLSSFEDIFQTEKSKEQRQTDNVLDTKKSDNIQDDDFFERLMLEAIEQKRTETGSYSETASDQDDWLDEIDDLVDEIVPDRREVIKSKTGFRHSRQAMLKRGTHKGIDVDVKYSIPGKVEVEISVTEEVYSSKPLENGDLVNNCVILAEISKDRYLGNCKKVTFLKTGDYQPYRDNEIEITRGPLTGMYGFIKTIYRPRVGILLNNSPITVDVDDIFYKDILLNNGKYFNVTEIKLGASGDYVINGYEIGDNNIKTISVNDIKQMMPGFQMGADIQEVEVHSDDESVFVQESEEKSVLGDQDESEEDDFDISSDTFDDVPGDNDDQHQQKSTFRDVERTSFMFSGWTSKQKGYIDIIKRILNIMVVDESLINTFELLEQLESVLDNFDKQITKAGEDFVVHSSQIDIKMILACLVVYKLSKEDEHFAGFDEYIKTLYNNDYFSGDITASMLAELYRVFKCTEIQRTRVEFERVTMFMKCYNRLLQGILGISLTLRAKIEKRIYEPVTRKERQYDKRTFILPDQLIPEIRLTDQDLDRKILWGPEYLKRIPKWKEFLQVKASQSTDNVKAIYSYIEKNIENSPIVLYKLRKDIVELLKKHKECDNTCSDNNINLGIKKIFGDREKMSGLTKTEKDTISYYITLKKFVPDFLKDMEKVRSNIQRKKTERMETIKRERESLMQRRTESVNKPIVVESERSKMVNKLKSILIRVFRERFDTTCRDEECKFKEVLEKVKRVLSNQEQMMLKGEEVDMFRKFAAEHSDYKMPEPPKIPKIILRLKKPGN